jgi:hypothetical protein
MATTAKAVVEAIEVVAEAIETATATTNPR